MGRQESISPKDLPEAGRIWQSYRLARHVATAAARLVRQQVFNQEEPPFSTLEDAWAWAEKQTPVPWDEKAEEAAVQELGRFVERAYKALRADPHPPPWVQIAPRFGIARLKLGPLKTVPAATENLRRLADGADHLVGLTGWQEDEAARFILTGTVPRLQSQVSWSLRRSGVLRLHLDVFPWQLHPAEWARLRRNAERLLPRFARQDRMLAGVHRRLLDLIARVGPPPASKGQGRPAKRQDYWERLARAWGKTYRQQRDWNTMWKLYASLPQNLRDEIEKGGDER